MSRKQKTHQDILDEFFKDYIKYKREEDKRADIIIRQNKRDLALLRKRLAMEDDREI